MGGASGESLLSCQTLPDHIADPESFAHPAATTPDSIPRQSTRFSGLKVDLSYYCPLRCDHCLFEAGPTRPKWVLSDSDIARIIKSAAEVGTFYSISIGHQEPFVQFDRLCDILQFLKSHFDGYGIALNTTAVWVKSREGARDKLSALRDLRLEMLMISVDDFHQAQVPLDKCIVCASVAQELGMRVVFESVYSRSSHRADYFRERMRFGIDLEKIDWIESPVCPCGHARRVIPESEWPRNSFDCGFCNVMEAMYVAPDGSVTPCCGGGLVAKGLVVGSLRAESMAQIVAKVEQDPILNSLAIHRGPAGLIKTLQREHPSWKPRPSYTGTCHACFEIMDDPALVESLRDSYGDRETELLLSRLYMEVAGGLFAVGDNQIRSTNE